MSGERQGTRDAMHRMGEHLREQGVPRDRIEQIVRGAAERRDDRVAGERPRPVSNPRKG